ncbi:MAG: type VI secretion system baseplate subunit TssG [Desulforhabdus sp.]|jgi:type VI secretion system protein ImpH|nr:type VI secretion system baseplate subunit TssG [Desulforhabdus sp.]
MAGTNRTATHPLNDWIGALEEEPYAFGFFHLLRLMECLYPERPRLGASRRPSADPIRLKHEPAMSFESASLTSFQRGEDGQPHLLTVRLLGLLGPNGPLPLHLTEYAQQRLRQHADPTFTRFLDIFHHRMLSLFYRAWANNEPTVSFDRPESDRFADYVGSFAGLGMSTLRQRDEMPDLTKLYFCGRLACQARCPDGLQAMTAEYFKLPVRVEEFIGNWLALPQKSVCRLGIDRTNGELGRSVILGLQVWDCQHKFRIVLGPLSFEEYESLLPGGSRIGQLVALIRNCTGDELAWDVRLTLKRSEVPAARLGGDHRLGWTTWLGDRPGKKDADDLVLDAFATVNP